jgi:nitroreductase
MEFNDAANNVLDRIILERRSIRRFTNQVPSKEKVEAIIQTGILAPYAGLAGKSLKETRRFVVLTKNSREMEQAKEIIASQLRRNAKRFNLLVKIVPYLRKNGAAFAKRLDNMAQYGVPAFETAPYYIIVGERKGIPPAQKQSLAHVMQNMWLKATALGLGFQLLSLTQTMSNHKEFMDLLGLPPGEFEIDGCVIGYSDQIPAAREEIKVDEITKWL